MRRDRNRAIARGLTLSLGLWVAAAGATLGQTPTKSPPAKPDPPTAQRVCPTSAGGEYEVSWGGGAPPNAEWHLYKDHGAGLQEILSGTLTLSTVTVPKAPPGPVYRLHVSVCYESATVTGCSVLSNGTNITYFHPSTCFPGACTQSSSSTLVALDGRGFRPSGACPYRLTRVGSEPSGARFLLDEWAVVSYPADGEAFSEVIVENASSEHFGQAQGRCLAQGRVAGSPSALAKTLGQRPGSEKPRASRTAVAIIAHVPHAMNERFMPIPEISLRQASVPYIEPPIEALLRIQVGMDEKIGVIDTVLESAELPLAAVEALRDHLQIDYADKRRHRMAVYALVRLAQGAMELQDVLVTLPECCPHCAPYPYVCQ